MRRPPHKAAHAQCPYGATNWADCDNESSQRWGRCTAMVDVKPEPHTCTNWAVAEDGWCGQHYISLHEKAMRKAREAARTLQLNERIDAFLAKTAAEPWAWLKALSPSSASIRGLQGVAPRPVAPVRVRKGPHRLTEADL